MVNNKIIESRLAELIFDELDSNGLRLPPLADYPWESENIEIVYFDLFISNITLNSCFSTEKLSLYAKACISEAISKIRKYNCLSPNIDTLPNFFKNKFYCLIGEKYSLALSNLDNSTIIGLSIMNNFNPQKENSGATYRVMIPYVRVPSFTTVFSPQYWQ